MIDRDEATLEWYKDRLTELKTLKKSSASAVEALLRVIAENGPAIDLAHPEDHGLTQAEVEAIATARGQ